METAAYSGSTTPASEWSAKRRRSRGAAITDIKGTENVTCDTALEGRLTKCGGRTGIRSWRRRPRRQKGWERTRQMIREMGAAPSSIIAKYGGRGVGSDKIRKEAGGMDKTDEAAGSENMLKEPQTVENVGNVEELDEKPRRKRSDQTVGYKKPESVVGSLSATSGWRNGIITKSYHDSWWPRKQREEVQQPHGCRRTLPCYNQTEENKPVITVLICTKGRKETIKQRNLLHQSPTKSQ